MYRKRKKREVPDAFHVTYRGVDYYSQNHARHAAYLTKHKLSFEYFPKRFKLADGTIFSPTFLVKNVLIQGRDGKRWIKKLWWKVDGLETLNKNTIELLSDDPDHPVLITSDFPIGKELDDIENFILKKHRKHSYLFSFKTIDGYDDFVFPGLDKYGRFKLYRPDIALPKDRDAKKTVEWYRTAWQTFEHGVNMEEKRRSEIREKRKAEKASKPKKPSHKKPKSILSAKSTLELFERSLATFTFLPNETRRRHEAKKKNKPEINETKWPPELNRSGHSLESGTFTVPSIFNKEIHLSHRT